MKYAEEIILGAIAAVTAIIAGFFARAKTISEARLNKSAIEHERITSQIEVIESLREQARFIDEQFKIYKIEMSARLKIAEDEQGKLKNQLNELTDEKAQGETAKRDLRTLQNLVASLQSDRVALAKKCAQMEAINADLTKRVNELEGFEKGKSK